MTSLQSTLKDRLGSLRFPRLRIAVPSRSSRPTTGRLKKEREAQALLQKALREDFSKFLGSELRRKAPLRRND
jgi:hypothetical protein